MSYRFGIVVNINYKSLIVAEVILCMLNGENETGVQKPYRITTKAETAAKYKKGDWIKFSNGLGTLEIHRQQMLPTEIVKGQQGGSVRVRVTIIPLPDRIVNMNKELNHKNGYCIGWSKECGRILIAFENKLTKFQPYVGWIGTLLDYEGKNEDTHIFEILRKQNQAYWVMSHTDYEEIRDKNAAKHGFSTEKGLFVCDENNNMFIWNEAQGLVKVHKNQRNKFVHGQWVEFSPVLIEKTCIATFIRNVTPLHETKIDGKMIKIKTTIEVPKNPPSHENFFSTVGKVNDENRLITLKMENSQITVFLEPKILSDQLKWVISEIVGTKKDSLQSNVSHNRKEKAPVLQTSFNRKNFEEVILVEKLKEPIMETRVLNGEIAVRAIVEQVSQETNILHCSSIGSVKDPNYILGKNLKPNKRLKVWCRKINPVGSVYWEVTPNPEPEEVTFGFGGTVMGKNPKKSATMAKIDYEYLFTTPTNPLPNSDSNTSTDSLYGNCRPPNESKTISSSSAIGYAKNGMTKKITTDDIFDNVDKEFSDQFNKSKIFAPPVDYNKTYLDYAVARNVYGDENSDPNLRSNFNVREYYLNDMMSNNGISKAASSPLPNDPWDICENELDVYNNWRKDYQKLSEIKLADENNLLEGENGNGNVSDSDSMAKYDKFFNDPGGQTPLKTYAMAAKNGPDTEVARIKALSKAAMEKEVIERDKKFKEEGYIGVVASKTHDRYFVYTPNFSVEPFLMAQDIYASEKPEICDWLEFLVYPFPNGHQRVTDYRKIQPKYRTISTLNTIRLSVYLTVPNDYNPEKYESKIPAEFIKEAYDYRPLIDPKIHKGEKILAIVQRGKWYVSDGKTCGTPWGIHKIVENSGMKNGAKTIGRIRRTTIV